VQDHRAALNVPDNNVDSAVVIEVSESGTAAWLRHSERRSHKSADIPKCSGALVQEYEFALPVLGSGLEHVHLRINVTIDGELSLFRSTQPQPR
jgi:hypothetical protein